MLTTIEYTIDFFCLERLKSRLCLLCGQKFWKQMKLCCFSFQNLLGGGGKGIAHVWFYSLVMSSQPLLMFCDSMMWFYNLWRFLTRCWWIYWFYSFIHNLTVLYLIEGHIELKPGTDKATVSILYLVYKFVLPKGCNVFRFLDSIL